MIKFAIFDLDGTLLDSTEMWQMLGVRYLELSGIIPEKDLTAKLSEMSMPESALYLRDTYKLPYSAEEIVRQFAGMTEKFYKEQVALKDGAPRLLAQLRMRCIKMSIATAGDVSLGMAALTRLGAADFFSGAVSCTEYGAKTSPEVFLAAAELMDAVPEETVVFEDSLHAVRSAKKAGFRTAAVYDIGESCSNELKNTADYYAQTLDELTDDLAEILS